MGALLQNKTNYCINKKRCIFFHSITGWAARLKAIIVAFRRIHAGRWRLIGLPPTGCNFTIILVCLCFVCGDRYPGSGTSGQSLLYCKIVLFMRVYRNMKSKSRYIWVENICMHGHPSMRWCGAARQFLAEWMRRNESWSVFIIYCKKICAICVCVSGCLRNACVCVICTVHQCYGLGMEWRWIGIYFVFRATALCSTKASMYLLFCLCFRDGSILTNVKSFQRIHFARQHRISNEAGSHASQTSHLVILS